MDNKFEHHDDIISNSREEAIRKAQIELQNKYNNEAERKIERPNISTPKILIKLVIILICEIVGIVLAIKINLWILSFVLAIILLTFKSTIIDMILLYQKYAPERIRKACLFEPSCSQYMILAIEKYGTIRGIFKGIKRLLRCHPPNGGIDNP